MRTNGLIAGLFLVLALGWFAPYLWPGHALAGAHPGSFSPFRENLAQELREELDRRHLVFADKLIQHHPEVVFTAEAVKARRLPAWNPWVLGGLPHLATGLSSSFYPPLWLSFLVDPPRCYAWIAALHFFLGGLFFFAMLQGLGVSRSAAFFGGVLFSASGWMSVRQEYFQLVGPAVWMPLAILGAARVAKRRSGALLLAIAVAMSFLTGFPQIAVYNVLAAGLVVLLRPVSWDRRVLTRTWSRFALACLVGLLIAAPQLFATIELVAGNRSTREQLSQEQLLDRALPPASLVSAALPELFDHPDFASRLEGLKVNLFGVLHCGHLQPGSTARFAETTFYLGPLVLLLLPLALLTKRRGTCLLFLILGSVALVLALPTPLLRISAHLPGLNVGDPKRYLFVLTVALAALAALGLEVWQSARPAARRAYLILLTGICLVLVLLTLALYLQGEPRVRQYLLERLASQFEKTAEEVAAIIPERDFMEHHGLLVRETALLTLWCCLAVAGMFFVHRSRRSGQDPSARSEPESLPSESSSSLQGPTVTPPSLTPPSGAVAVSSSRAATLVLGLAALVPLYVLWISTTSPVPLEHWNHRPPFVEALARTASHGRIARLEIADAAFPPFTPKLPMLHKIRDAQGYVAAYLLSFKELLEALQTGSTQTIGATPFRDPKVLERPLIDALDIEWLIERGPRESPPAIRGFEPVAAPVPETADSPVMTRLWRNRENLGRAWFVRELVVFASKEKCLGHLASAQFQPALEAVRFDPDPSKWANEWASKQGFALVEESATAAPDMLRVRYQPRDAVNKEAPACRMLEEVDSRLRIETSGDGGLLVISDCAYPGWTASVDQAPAEILVVDHALRGIVVPPGPHQVELVYRPRWLFPSLWAAGTGILLLLALAFLFPSGMTGKSSRE